MPVPTTVRPEKNIWVAASDGDLERVMELVEGGLSPNIADSYTYTPMHAAASYGYIHVLEYLISRGGDVNVRDEDNETPLFGVETVAVARWLVDHGAITDLTNSEGISLVSHLSEDFPEVSEYISSLQPAATPVRQISTSTSPSTPPTRLNYATERSADVLTSDLLSRVGEVMQRADADGHNPDEELRQIVGNTVLEGMLQGVQLGENADEDARRSRNGEHNARAAPNGDDGGGKRSRS